MSGGLTSYPRTGGGGGSYGAQIDALIKLLLIPGGRPLQAEADRLIQLLQQAVGTMPPQSIVIYGKRARDALFVARLNGALALARHLQAMELCAQAWKSIRSLDSTALKGRSDAAKQKLVLHAAQGGTIQELRAIKEEIGLIAWLYETSALLGDDLAGGIIAQSSTYPGSRYVGATDTSGVLAYLECAGAYNVNVVVRVAIPGASQPLLMVGEAKGGKSGFGVVKTSKLIRQMGHIAPTVSQNEIMYAPSRALYMQKAMRKWKSGTAPAHVAARQQAGKLIMDAYRSLSLCYVTVRGDATANSPIKTSRVKTECR
ncbi:hypothetical protein [Pseudomonas hunanensis]|uniref:hypothetical protein n=1 Tax=Pseudomonas hunanensis TaxID=1247546 RepID=UPI0030D73AEC